MWTYLARQCFPFLKTLDLFPIPGLPEQLLFACPRPRVTWLPRRPHRLQVQQNNRGFCGPLTLIVRLRDEDIRANPSLTLFPGRKYP